MTVQAERADLPFRIEIAPCAHVSFPGDTLRIDQILIDPQGSSFNSTLENESPLPNGGAAVNGGLPHP